jgi:hypothetical protein
MVVKEPRYFCDAMQVAEAATYSGYQGGSQREFNGKTAGQKQPAFRAITETRNPRSFWKIASEAYKGKHFAAFPGALPHKCILAATSSYGCCPQCGAQYAPIVVKDRVPTRPGENTKVDGKSWDKNAEPMPGRMDRNVIGNRDPHRHVSVKRVEGHRPTCECDAGEGTGCGQHRAAIRGQRIGTALPAADCRADEAAVGAEREACRQANGQVCRWTANHVLTTFRKEPTNMPTIYTEANAEVSDRIARMMEQFEEAVA